MDLYDTHCGQRLPYHQSMLHAKYCPECQVAIAAERAYEPLPRSRTLAGLTDLLAAKDLAAQLVAAGTARRGA